jgi:ankyrin repeat protein
LILKMACNARRSDVVKYLIKQKISPVSTAEINRVFHRAIIEGKLSDLVEFLIKSGAEVNTDDKGGSRPLSLAFEFESGIETIKCLIRHGAVTVEDEDEDWLLGLADDYKDNVEIVNFLTLRATSTSRRSL